MAGHGKPGSSSLFFWDLRLMRGWQNDLLSTNVMGSHRQFALPVARYMKHFQKLGLKPLLGKRCGNAADSTRHYSRDNGLVETKAPSCGAGGADLSFGAIVCSHWKKCQSSIGGMMRP